MEDLRIPKVSNESQFANVKNVFESLRTLVESNSWSDVRELILCMHRKLKHYEKLVVETTPVVHTFLRIIKIAREEALKTLLGCNADFEENTTNRLFASGDVAYEAVTKSSVYDAILSALDEFFIDIQSCSENISDLSLDLVHSDELILTRGYSGAAYQFLRRVGEKKRMFKVIVCEGFPENLGHKFATDLSNDGINAILVPDSHVFGLMSRINKVIIGCTAVYPDGTMKAPVGTHSVLIAAKHFAIPTYVCLPQYELSPIPPKACATTPSFTVLPTADPSNVRSDWLDSPELILPFADPLVSSYGLTNRAPSIGPVVWAPRFEYIPSGLVSLFLTNLGSHAPSYLYALCRELFHPLDIQLVTTSDSCTL